jgi:hypothetical protein
MKKIFLVFITCIFAILSIAKEKPDKTFLIIFNEDELAYHQANADFMLINFSDVFDTKLYSGNSETALIVTVPFAEWTVCEMGSALIKVSKDRELPLSEIAFRIIDLDESQENFKSLLSGPVEKRASADDNLIKLNL